jgi:hypothetical protein
MEFVNEKYFRVLLGVNDSPQLSYRQIHRSFLAADVSGRDLTQTRRLGLARNFEFFTDVSFGTDDASLLVKGQTPAAPPKENQWRPQQVGTLVYFYR